MTSTDENSQMALATSSKYRGQCLHPPVQRAVFASTNTEGSVCTQQRSPVDKQMTSTSKHCWKKLICQCPGGKRVAYCNLDGHILWRVDKLYHTYGHFVGTCFKTSLSPSLYKDEIFCFFWQSTLQHQHAYMLNLSMVYLSSQCLCLSPVRMNYPGLVTHLIYQDLL